MNDGKSRGVVSGAPLVIHGWSIFGHGSFLDHFESLIAEVETLKERHPQNWYRKNSAKRLLAIRKLITETIPASPTSTQFRQGNTLGRSRKHWFRAKFYQQYRLFFQFNSVRKIIVYAWVNDDKSLRARGSNTDAYETFKGMLDSGNPPDSFDSLLIEAKASAKRFEDTLKSVPNPDIRIP